MQSRGRLTVSFLFLVSSVRARTLDGDLQLADKGKIDRELAEAGWKPDDSFSEYLSIGESDDLCVLFTAALGRQMSPHLRTIRRGVTRLLSGL